MTFFVGTSGWQYDDWRPAFYPKGLGKARWLEHYAARFSTMEVNSTCYRLPSDSVVAAWASRTPEDFVLAVKASRFLTHIKRLHEPAEPAARLIERCRHLGNKLGPILLQLPPNLAADLDALRETLIAFPRQQRVAVEFRNPSWFNEQTARLLGEFDAAFCQADAPSHRTPHWRTASFGYVRFHAGTGRPRPCYTPRALEQWAAALSAQYPSGDVYVYLNNDPGACAPRDAVRFAQALVHHGARVARVPSLGETRLARSA